MTKWFDYVLDKIDYSLHGRYPVRSKKDVIAVGKWVKDQSLFSLLKSWYRIKRMNDLDEKLRRYES